MRLLLVPTLFLLGCPASVTAEGIDDGFGMGLSAVWIDQGRDGQVLVLSNVLDVCTKQATFMEATEEYFDAAFDVMNEDYCADIEEPLREFVAASEALYVEGNSFASFSAVPKFGEGEFEFGKKASGTVQKVTESFDTSFLEDFDADGDAEDGCGMGFESGEDGGSDYWTLVDGALTITAFADEGTMGGSVDASMENAKGQDDGAFTASFSAAYCEL